MASPDLDQAHDTTDEHGGHTTDADYIKIGIVLAVLTAIEVALFYFPPGAAEVPLLLGLMVVKFAIVAAYFMHLKGDNKVLTLLFSIGLGMATLVYFAVLFAFEFF